MKIERSEALGRNIRREKGNALAMSTWDGIREAVRAGKIEDAVAGLEYGRGEAKMMYDSGMKFADEAVAYHAGVAGDMESYKTLRVKFESMVRQHEEEGLLLEAIWDGVREAILENRVEDAFAGLETGCARAEAMHDRAFSLVEDALTHIAKVAGEEEVYKVLRARYEPVIRRWLSTTPGLEESIERAVEFQRGHFGKTSIREESDRYVVTCDPCGSGGRLRRTKTVARTRRANDATWNEPNVPLYCTHCAVMWEILPMEIRGIPIRINLPPKLDSDPCVHLYYKSARAIPEEYFKRVSRTREVAVPSDNAGEPSGPGSQTDGTTHHRP